MKQIHKLLLLMIAFVMLVCSTAFAGEDIIIRPMSVNCGWKQDANGWWYQNEDGGYPLNQWELVDGVWYCFDTDGYMLSDTYIFNMSEFRRKMAAGLGGRDVYVYYVTSDGSMFVNSYTPDGKWANESGEINLVNGVIGKRVALMIDINKCYLIEEGDKNAR